MLARVHLRFGASVGAAPLEFVPGPMTVFVGPNNSGKSLALRELEHAVQGWPSRGLPATPYMGGVPGHIVARIDVVAPGRDEVLRFLFGPDRAEVIRSGPVAWVWTGRTHGRVGAAVQVSLPALLLELDAADSFRGTGVRLFVEESMLRLDGETRLQLLQGGSVGDFQAPTDSHLMALFRDDRARARLRAEVADALGLHLVIDPTRALQVRVASRAPTDEEEKSLGPSGLAFYRETVSIEEHSDGVRAFAGLVTALLSADFRTILVDEPEAFLHPPLARRLGGFFAQVAAERGGNVFAATHSPEFLMGCVQAGGPVNVVRLTYAEGVPGARLLAAAELQRLVRDPLLRSAGVLNALFHAGAVLCEGGVDRAFYEEINRRLLATARGVGDVLFIDGIGKQSLHHLIAPLRQVGVPAAVVVDLDILKEGDLRRLLLAASVPEGLADSWDLLKRKVNAAFHGRGLDPKHVGVEALEAPARAMAESLIADVARYGVFIVPVGEVERWLAPLGVGAPKGRWLMAMFERLGSDPVAADYVHPAAGDVWAFVDNIAGWIANPTREGIPR